MIQVDSGTANCYIYDTGSPKITLTYNAGVKPDVTATAGGNGVNSGTGYVNLSWPKDPSTAGYKVLLYNGTAYVEIASGNITSYTTKGKGVWPTPDQIAAGNYSIKPSGGGGELAMLPTPVYDKTGGNPASNTHYYFQVIAYNKNGDTLDPNKYAWTGSVLLPDTVQPLAPTSVAVAPKDNDTVTVAWNGIEDITPSGKATTLAGGQIEYKLDGDPAVQTGWAGTGKNTASGSFELSTASLTDGNHMIYIRGKDAAGNYGAWMGTDFTVDKAPPTKPTVALHPGAWTNGQYIEVQWSGLTDAGSGLANVEIQIGDGAWKPTGSAGGSGAVSIDTSTFPQGRTAISVRGTDAAGNVGAPGTATAYTDRTAPTVGTMTVPDWTKENTVQLRWTGVADNPGGSGLASMAWQLEGGTAWTNIPLSQTPDGAVNVPVSTRAEGTHAIRLRLTDNAGNERTEEREIKIDRTAPTLATLTIQEAWTNADSLALSWTGVADAASGVKSITLQVDGGTAKTLGLTGTGSETIDASALADGTHTLRFTLTDNAGNAGTWTRTLQTDHTNPGSALRVARGGHNPRRQVNPGENPAAAGTGYFAGLQRVAPEQGGTGVAGSKPGGRDAVL